MPVADDAWAGGSGLGGQWGAAADEQNAYIGVSDLQTQTPGGLRAINLATGAMTWSMEPQTRLCNQSQPSCRAAQGDAEVARQVPVAEQARLAPQQRGVVRRQRL